MKDILKAPFMVETVRLLSNMYRLGWDERNGGNLSYMLKEEDYREYVGGSVIREIPTGFCAKSLAGKVFLVTGTGKYFKNVEYDPENNLGIIRISADGNTAELLWGYSDGGKFTSELPAHLMSHVERLKLNPEHRVVLHTHPAHIIAMTLIHDISERAFTRTLWQVATECIVVFPDGIGTLPWMICGTDEIGRATAEKLKEFRACVWTAHGVFGTGATLDEAFGLVETIEEAANIYCIARSAGQIINGIKDDELKVLAERFKVTPKVGWLDV